MKSPSPSHEDSEVGEMTIVVPAESSQTVRPLLTGYEDLEKWLRGFRARELARRDKPTARQMWIDGIGRLVPMLAGYCGMLLLAYPLDIIAAAFFALATISML